MSQMTSLPSSKPSGGSPVPSNEVQILHHGPQGFSPTLLSLGSLFLLPSPLADSTPAIPLFLQYIKHAYASGPLHWLCPLPGNLFPRYPHIPFLHLHQVLVKRYLIKEGFTDYPRIPCPFPSPFPVVVFSKASLPP